MYFEHVGARICVHVHACACVCVCVYVSDNAETCNPYASYMHIMIPLHLEMIKFIDRRTCTFNLNFYNPAMERVGHIALIF